MTAEQDKQRRDDIARQREERLKQRALRKEIMLNGDELASLGMLNGDGENSQASNVSGAVNGTSQHAASDFNIRNYFLMLKVMNKIQQCKYSWPFKDPVSEEDAPDYKELIDVRFHFYFTRLDLKFNSFRIQWTCLPFSIK